MKLTLETQEWQLLGQLAIEISQGQFKYALPALILWEFYLDNIQTFHQPKTSKRKIRNSTAIGIYQHLRTESNRDDTLWDITLNTLKDKLYQKILSIKTTETLHFKTILSAN